MRKPDKIAVAVVLFNLAGVTLMVATNPGIAPTDRIQSISRKVEIAAAPVSQPTLLPVAAWAAQNEVAIEGCAGGPLVPGLDGDSSSIKQAAFFE